MTVSPSFLPADGEALLRAAEVATGVSNRQQFFLWLRLHLHRFVPHELLLCRLGSLRPGADPRVEVFNCVPLPADLAEGLGSARQPLWRELQECWLQGGRRPVCVPLAGLQDDTARQLRAAGFDRLMVHGVDLAAGVQPALLLAVGRLPDALLDEPACAEGLRHWLPYLHFSAARALQDAAAAEADPAWPALLTERELDVLRAVRGARSNAEIGEQLGISALTVKNHLRKIMRKLGAGNRVQAVAEAMARRLIH